MTASLKLRQLESKISTLQAQHQAALKERQKEIATLLTSLDLASLDDTVLIGGLLFVKDKIANKDSLVEVWQDVGTRFLRRPTSKRGHSSLTSKVTLSPQAHASKSEAQQAISRSESRDKQSAKPTDVTA